MLKAATVTAFSAPSKQDNLSFSVQIWESESFEIALYK